MIGTLPQPIPIAFAHTGRLRAVRFADESETVHGPRLVAALGYWGRCAAVAWTIAFVAISIRVMLSKPRTHNDYLTFANTARHWVAGKGLYRQCDEDGFYDDFRYSPLVACSLVPISFLPDRLGSIAWRLVNLGIFLGGLYWWGRRALTPQPSGAHLGILFLLVLPLAVGNVNNGQSNPLVLGFLLAAVAAVIEDAGTCAACSSPAPCCSRSIRSRSACCSSPSTRASSS